MIYKKSAEEIASMRRAGRIVAHTLARLQDAIRPGVTTKELDRIGEESIIGAGAVPSFKGYRGYPASICTSPNDVIVHGIPADRQLEEGDIISLDVGAFYENFHADSAWTFAVGDISPEAAELLRVTEGSLEAAILVCKPKARLGDIGHAVQTAAEAGGFSVVREYAGHGVGRALHEEPSIPNFGPPGRREVLAPGMTLAIEPMVNAGGPETKVLSDHWTVVTADGSLSAHFEHTVAITESGYEVLTRSDDIARVAAL
ncbi:MAG TPA: type I methionyl aminopeptidase [Actinomycetota bacterium]|nr:type I methionyl aminopeptidase [Actinomycetota bacterium]